MADRGDPPEGPSENGASGSEDEYRSLVFDESFVRAARLQEFSAQERMGEHARAVRSLPGRSVRNGSRAALALVVLIALAFGAAVFMGFRHPYQNPVTRRAEPMRMTVVPLSPRGAVPAGTPAGLFASSPAASFPKGAAGISLPVTRRTDNFSDSQVYTALATAKDYLMASSLDLDVLGGNAVRPVESLLDPDQMPQFERSMDTPQDDGQHAATGWLVRFDPAEVTPDPEIRVRGTLRYAETGADALEVVSDHTFAYVLHPAVSGPRRAGGASLFTVRREMRFRFDRDDLRLHRLEVRTSYVQAGPQSCPDDTTGALRPLLAGERAVARGPAGTDPYATGRPTGALCGTLEISSRPSPDRTGLQGPQASGTPASRP
ncbi:SCO2583 family membrane protein [Streptomyces sp. NPDC002666]